MEQWKEELEILDAELERTVAWFATMSDLWNTLADSTISSKPGYSEYAYQKADMHARRSADAKAKHQWAIKTISEANEKGSGPSLFSV